MATELKRALGAGGSVVTPTMVELQVKWLTRQFQPSAHITAAQHLMKYDVQASAAAAVKAQQLLQLWKPRPMSHPQPQQPQPQPPPPPPPQQQQQ